MMEYRVWDMTYGDGHMNNSPEDYIKKIWSMTYGDGYIDNSPEVYITYDGRVVEIEDENISWGGIDYTIKDITENMIVMMYVQMKDINDKKIFEGDIMEDGDGNKVEVVFDSGHTMIKPYESDGPAKMMFKVDISKHMYKVIGCIYDKKY